MRTDEDIAREVETDFAEMEAELARTAGPGVLEMLRVYGDYDQALREAEAYLTPAPAIFTTTDNTG